MRLANKIAIVVGAGQQPGETMGNGRATALRFAEEGATVLVVDRDQALATDTLAMIEDKGGAGTALAADITSEDDCRAIAETCVERYGRIDILHNNVGRSEGDRETATLDADVWDGLMAMNLRGMFLTCKHVLPVMRELGSGAIVNISSKAAILGSPNEYIDYAASKGAIETLTTGLAKEVATEGIRVNAVRPGLIETDIHALSGDPDRPDKLRATIPMQRSGEVEEVAQAIVWLASDEASYSTGAFIDVTGGR